jgi:hypothetical protein
MRNPFSKASRDARMEKIQARADRIIAEQNAKGVAAQEEYARWQAGQGGGGASVCSPQATAPPSLDPSQPLPLIRDLLKQALEYQDDVLHARLDRLTGPRPPLDTEYRPPPSLLSEVFDMFNPLDPMHAFPQVFGRRDRPQLGPYCGEA